MTAFARTVSAMDTRSCVCCHHRLRGRRRIYCSDACRLRAYRRRKAKLPEGALYDGRRGRVALGQLTKDELAYELTRIRRETSDKTEAIRAGRAALERSATPMARRRLEDALEVYVELAERLP
jgi:hypothetical protein